jgi:RNA polymerase sigma-70 factor (ECF subfamily)
MSFDEVYKAHYQELQRFGRHLNISSENTSDLIQETFLRFYLELKKKVVINNPRAWLYKVLLNLFRTRVNSEKRELHIKEELTTGKAGSYDLQDEYLNTEKQQIVLKILGRMPDRDKEILLLYNNGFSYNEMAEILEINPNSIGQTIVRAIEKLKETLKHHYQGADK